MKGKILEQSLSQFTAALQEHGLPIGSTSTTCTGLFSYPALCLAGRPSWTILLVSPIIKNEFVKFEEHKFLVLI